MKVILTLVPQSQVVRELLQAIETSHWRFSQDRSFDFRLVKIDCFRVPPLRTEAIDDACLSYQLGGNAHPSAEDMRQILERRDQWEPRQPELRYAAILFRSGNFKPDAYWGGTFYYASEPTSAEAGEVIFLRADCRENCGYEGSPDVRYIHDVYKLPGVDRFSLQWVLAWSKRKLDVEFGSDCQYSLVVSDLARYRSGLGELESLENKAGGRFFLGGLSPMMMDLRYGWISAATSNVPRLYDGGAGLKLEKLFRELKPKQA